MKRLLLIQFNAAFYGATRSVAGYRLRSELEKYNINLDIIDFAEYAIESGKIYDMVSTDYDRILISTNFAYTRNTNYSYFAPGGEEKFIKFLQFLKTKSKLLVAGGANIGVFKELYDSYFDCFVEGYGETTILKIAQDPAEFWPLTDGARLLKSTGTPTSNIRTVFKNSDHIQPNEMLPLEISRGCMFRCSFCSYPENGRKKNEYIRPIEEIRADILDSYYNFGVTSFRLLDDTFNESDSKVDAVCDMFDTLPFDIKLESYIRHDIFTARQMSRLKGRLINFTLGLETLNDASGKSIGKGYGRQRSIEKLHEIAESMPGSYVNSGFILGLPSDTRKSLEEEIKIIKTLPLNSVNMYVLNIRKASPYHYLSDFEKNYDSYGYEKIGETATHVKWKINDLNQQACFKMKIQFESSSPQYNRSNSIISLATVGSAYTDSTESIAAAERKFAENYFNSWITARG
jgi:radical SAM superfamily enzyme YgiQ (UPF0313 family)